jgi:hypothetical protein
LLIRGECAICAAHRLDGLSANAYWRAGCPELPEEFCVSIGSHNCCGRLLIVAVIVLTAVVGCGSNDSGTKQDSGNLEASRADSERSSASADYIEYSPSLGYDFEYLLPEQQAKIKSIHDMTYAEFRLAPIEDIMLYGRWIEDNLREDARTDMKDILEHSNTTNSPVLDTVDVIPTINDDAKTIDDLRALQEYIFTDMWRYDAGTVGPVTEGRDESFYEDEFKLDMKKFLIYMADEDVGYIDRANGDIDGLYSGPDNKITPSDIMWEKVLEPGIVQYLRASRDATGDYDFDLYGDPLLHGEEIIMQAFEFTDISGKPALQWRELKSNILTY